MFEEQNIPIRKLDRSRDHKFKFIPNAAQIQSLLDDNQWRNLKDIKIEGDLLSRDEGWELKAKITGVVSLTCVISGAPIHRPLAMDIRRLYLRQNEELPSELSWDLEFDVDIEHMEQNLELLPLIAESIALDVPDYPKLTKYENDAPWQYQEVTDAEEDRQKPFGDLKERLAAKKT